MAQLNKKDVNYFLVVGAALYWSSALLSLLSNDAPAALGAHGAMPGGRAELLRFTTPTVAVLLAASTVLARFFSYEVVRKAMTAAIIGASSLVILFAGADDVVAEGLGVLYGPMLVLLRSIESSGLILLWGYAFASLDKKTAGQTVTLTALCSVFGYFCLIGLTQYVPQVYTVQTVYIVSAALLLSGRIRFVNQKRARTSKMRRRAGFFVSRALWGLVIGVVSVFAGGAVQAQSALLFVGTAIIVGLLLAYLFSQENLYMALPVFPLVITGLVFVPFLLDGLGGIERSAVPMLWVAWILLSSFQLSELKEAFGMSETEICFSEKAVLMVFWSIGAFAGGFLWQTVPLDFAGSETGGILALVATYTVIIFASYSMFSLVYSRREDQLLVEMARSREQRMARLYDEIAEEHRLSSREREVMEMLAQGYTRTYIMEKLVISDGTAKAHIAHVYQKLGIHKKDDLLKLVSARERSLEVK